MSKCCVQLMEDCNNHANCSNEGACWMKLVGETLAYDVLLLADTSSSKVSTGTVDRQCKTVCKMITIVKNPSATIM